MPTFAFHTYGCQMNVRESEAAAKALLDAGHTPAPDEASADIVIVNSCSVRGKAEDKALGKLGLLCATKRERPDRVIGLMGCMAQRLGNEVFRRVPTLDFAIGTRCADRVAPAVEAALQGRPTLALRDLHAQPDAPSGHMPTADSLPTSPFCWGAIGDAPIASCPTCAGMSGAARHGMSWPRSAPSRKMAFGKSPCWANPS